MGDRGNLFSVPFLCVCVCEGGHYTHIFKDTDLTDSSGFAWPLVNTPCTTSGQAMRDAGTGDRKAEEEMVVE